MTWKQACKLAKEIRQLGHFVEVVEYYVWGDLQTPHYRLEIVDQFYHKITVESQADWKKRGKKVS